MKNEEKIRKYIEGELTGEELINFENGIKNSSSLKREIDLYVNTLNQFKKLNTVNAEESYFVNILPRFRESISKQKRAKFKPVYAFGSVALVIIVSIIFFLFNSDETGDNQLALQQLDSQELNSYLNNYSSDLTNSDLTEEIPEEYDSLLSSMVAGELNTNDSSGNYLVDVSGNDFYNFINNLSNEEADGIYSTLINKKIY